MTWASILSTGTGKIVGFRLTIEGWPDVWVSHPDITYADNKDGRNVYNGLLTEGLGFSEELNLHEARTIVRGFTAKVRSTTTDDKATASFSTYNRPVSFLQAALTDTGTTISASPTLSNSTTYHIGTEAIAVGTYPTITRKKWNTHAQGHPGGATGLYGESVQMPIYDKPPTMDGRRANLFVYAEGDDMDGDGTIVFRGIVQNPPTLESDGLTWSIRVNPITDLLAQHIAAQDLRANLYGIYHHKRCQLSIQCHYNGADSDMYYVTGLHDNLNDLIAAVNDKIDTMLSDMTATNVTSLVVAPSSDQRRMFLRLRTAATAPTFTCHITSPLIGTAWGVEWHAANPTTDGLGPVRLFNALSTSSDYAVEFGREAPSAGLNMKFISAASDQMACLGESFSPYYDTADTNTIWRIHLDKDLSDQVAAGTFIHVAGVEGFEEGVGRTGSLSATTGGEFRFEVSAQGTTPAGNTYYVDIVPPPGTGLHGIGFLSGAAEITPLRDYGEGDVTDFKTGITTESVDANWGDTPFITQGATDPYGDFATWALDSVASGWLLDRRKYVFSTSKSLGEILREELKLQAHYLYLDDDFRMQIRRYPAVGANMTSDVTIGTSATITPDGKRGMWPGWAPQADGLINEIEIKTGYNAITDDFEGRPFVVRDVYSIAEHKSRGKGKMTIAPYSETDGVPEWDDIYPITVAIMGVMARDYIQVDVEVPLSLFGVKVGDVVLFTNPQVPNGTGGRGMTSKRAIIWRRQWNLDPRRAGGKLRLYIPTHLEGGYTPSGYVTGQTDNGSDNWDVVMSSANNINIAWSENGDGKVTDHFAAGDYIEVLKYGDSSETRVTGTIDSVDGDNDTVVVSLDSTWTPGSDTWVLEWRKDTGSTATTRQQGYTYTADGNVALVNGNAAWRFV